MGASRGPGRSFAAAWLLLAGCETGAVDPPGETTPRHRTAGALSVELPARADRAIVLANARRSAFARVRLAGAQPAPARDDGDRRVFASALGPGFDWQVAPKADAIEDTLALPSAPVGGEVRYRVELGAGVAGLRVAAGTVELVDDRGTPVLRVAGAAVIERTGDRRSIDLDVEGCDVDRDARAPFRRAVTDPGAASCDVVARLPADLDYPATFDPLWSGAGAMAFGRFGLELVGLDDGTVLAVGGQGLGLVRELEVFDPTTLTWSTLGDAAKLPVGADEFALSKLDDGRVLLTGGAWDISGTAVVPYAIAFDPTVGTWASLPDMAIERHGHSSTLMSDGRVLIAGGLDTGSVRVSSCEIFDPATDTWTPTAALPEGRAYHRAVPIGDRVLVVSGLSATYSNDPFSLVFDPASGGSWSQPAGVTLGRYSHTVVPLGADHVLMVGGVQDPFGTPANLIEVYDVATASWSTPMCSGVPCTTAPMIEARAVPGPLGGALVTGGCGQDGSSCFSASGAAWWFDPALGKPYPAGSISPARGKHAMRVLGDGRVVVAGGESSADDFGLTDTDVFQVEVPGAGCTQDFECASGHCADGVCCDGACDGACEACTLALTGQPDGTCAPVLDATDPDDDCVDGGAPACEASGVCVGGACAAYAGPGCDAGGCDAASDCASGFCVDGVCCDTACSGNCVACSAAKKGEGQDGVCGFVARATDPDAECDDAAETCQDAMVCDGLGVCRTGAEACAPWACDAAGCTTTCVNDAECGPTGACVASACVPAEQLCTEQSRALLRDGTTVDCAPYRCTAEGGCLVACTSVDDCAGGTVCDGELGTCVPPPASSGGDGGCACRAGRDGGDGPLAFGLFCASILGLVHRRRRR